MKRLSIIAATTLTVVIALFFVRSCYLSVQMERLNKMNTLYKTHQAQERLDSTRYTQDFPHDYSSLLKNQFKVKVIQTVESKRKNPITELIYDNSYYIQVYKIDSVGTTSLKKLIIDNFGKSNLPLGKTYWILGDNTPFEIYYKVGPRESSVSQLYFSIHGLNTKIIQKNDSLVYYYTGLEDFSIKYNPDSTYNIFSQIKKESDFEKSVEILFLRRNGKLYFLLLENINDKASISTNSLYDLIQW